MSNYKPRADRLHDRQIGNIEAADRRRMATIALPAADLRRAAKSLGSRAEQLMARRDKDPILRNFAELEAKQCRRLAAAIAAAIEGAAA